MNSIYLWWWLVLRNCFIDLEIWKQFQPFECYCLTHIPKVLVFWIFQSYAHRPTPTHKHRHTPCTLFYVKSNLHITLKTIKMRQTFHQKPFPTLMPEYKYIRTTCICAFMNIIYTYIRIWIYVFVLINSSRTDSASYYTWSSLI